MAAWTEIHEEAVAFVDEPVTNLAHPTKVPEREEAKQERDRPERRPPVYGVAAGARRLRHRERGTNGDD